VRRGARKEGRVRVQNPMKRLEKEIKRERKTKKRAKGAGLGFSAHPHE
jgi:hypothetical protein